MFSCLTKLFNSTKLLLQQGNKTFMERKRKTTIVDGVAYRLLYAKNNSSQNIITAKINNFLNTTTNRSSFVDRDNQINVSFYEKIYTTISNLVSKQIVNNYTKQIIAVDGTHSNFNSVLGKEGFALNTNKLSCTPLISGIYNVTYNYPVTLDLVKHHDERKAFMDFVKNYDSIKNSIFVFDRGYYGNEFVYQLNAKNIDFICRIKKNSSLLVVDGVRTNDYKTILNINGTNIDMRIITYIINDKNYYIATNLFNENDYNINKIKQLYFDRWSIEEYFKFMKTHLNLSKMPEKNINGIHKTILANLIVSKLIYFISYMIEKKNNKLKVNKTVLTEGFYSEFILKFIYGKGFGRRFMTKFFKTFVKLHSHKENRHYKRKCNTPYLKWYVRQHLKRNTKITTVIDEPEDIRANG